MQAKPGIKSDESQLETNKGAVVEWN